MVELPALPAIGHEQLRAFVRFSLSQLRNRNDHHRFEHLCEALARQRITPNIVVGTGPVSAGGDQGRDFETFRGHTRGYLRDLGVQMELGDGDTIVFCCTVGHEDLRAKILDDARKVTESGTDVDVVVYFSEQDISTALRHELIEKAASDHRVRLEILDGQTLTSLLCDRDTFWIAVEFLDVPIHLAPGEAGPDWYADSRARWLSRKADASTSGDIVELTTCVRFATVNRSFRGDIPMWLHRLAPLLDDGIDPVLRRRARYETAVATYRGLGDLRPADDLVRSALQDALVSDSAEELDSAEILRMWSYGAWLYDATNITASELDSYGDQLERRLASSVDSTSNVDRRCRLQWILGRVRLRANVSALESSGLARGAVEPPPPVTNEEWETFLASRPGQRLDLPYLVDPEGALTAWSDVVGLLDDAPLFPVQSFAESVALHAADLYDDPRWSELVALLDQKVAAAAGREAAAGLARSRSLSLQAADRPFAALNELHRARVALVIGQSRDEGAEALFDAAEVYHNLGLLYAAKYYALAAGALTTVEGDEHLDPLVAASLLLTAECDFMAGNWFSLLALLPTAINAHMTRRVAPDEPGRWEDFGRLLITVSAVAKVASLIGHPRLTAWVDARLLAAGIDPDETRRADLGAFLPHGDREATLNFVSNHLGQPPFTDTGAFRVIRFAARGVRWRIQAGNTFDEVRAAERLGAAIQIVVAALGDEDLVFVETTVHVKVQTVPPDPDGKAANSMPRPTGRTADGGLKWDVTLTRDLGAYSVDMLSATREVAAVAVAILVSLSILPEGPVMSILGRVTDESLIRALFPHIRYDRAYAVLPLEDFAEEKRRALTVFDGVSAGYGEEVLSEHLAPIREPGPTFRGQTPLERIPDRYNTLAKTLRITAPRLSRDSRFRQVLAELRAVGWKDWHILMAISNLVTNFRLAESGEDPRDPAVLARWLRQDPEEPSEVQIDPAEITTENLRTSLMVSTGATVDAFGLEIRSPFTPDELLHILATRYGYWDYDSPHDDPFVATSA